MTGTRHGRRSFLTTVVVASAGFVGSRRVSATENDTDQTTNACPRRDDSDQTHQTPSPAETQAPSISPNVTYVDSGTEGPTAFIVGGIHGDERAGILAAHDITDWTPEYGRLVVLPEANPQAIKRNSRSTGSGDLNRKFVYGQQPTSELARSIWGQVVETEPDTLFTLQESRGIFNGAPSGVGQAVFHSPTSDATAATRMGIRRANRTISNKRLRFEQAGISGPNNAPNGLLTEKATYEANIPSFIIETYEGVNEHARVRWQKLITRGILDYYDQYA